MTAQLATVVTSFEGHLRGRRMAEHTTAGYLRDLRLSLCDMSEALGRPLSIEDLSREQLQAHLSRLAGHAAATVRRRAAALRSLLRFASGEQLCENAARDLIVPRMPPRKLPPVLSEEQIDALVEAPLRLVPPAQQTILHLRDAAVLEVLAATGLRSHEIAGADLAATTVRKRHVSMRVVGKGGKPRVVIVPEGRGMACLVAYLARRKEIAPCSPALFTNWYGARFTRDGVYKIVRRWGERAGIQAWPHLIRHSYATEMVAASGEAIRGVQELLGHENPKSTSFYAQVDEKRLLKTARRHHRAAPSAGQIVAKAAEVARDSGRLVGRVLGRLL